MAPPRVPLADTADPGLDSRTVAVFRDRLTDCAEAVPIAAGRDGVGGRNRRGCGARTAPRLGGS
jgi:hypothetical protein